MERSITLMYTPPLIIASIDESLVLADVIGQSESCLPSECP